MVVDELGVRRYEDCTDAYGDQEFHVEVYGSNADGLPDYSTLLTLQHITAFDRVYVPGTAAEIDSGIPTYAYHIPLPEPITGLDTGGTTCYWLSVSSRRTLLDSDWTCNWYWQTSDTIQNDRMAMGGGSPDLAIRWGDMAFCLDCGIQPGACTPYPGACCACDGTCREVSFRECREAGDDWHENTTCAALGPDACPTGPPANDTCAAVADAAYPSLVEGYYVIDNFCSDTDGVNPVITEWTDTVQLEGDVWFKYEHVIGCDHVYFYAGSSPAAGGGFDNVVSVYHDPGNPEACLCPNSTTEHDLLTNWACYPGYNVANDDSWSPYATGGGLYGPLTQGGCYMIRVSGKQGADYARGRGRLSVGTMCVDWWIPWPAPDTTGHDRNRYLAFSLDGFYTPIALRVRAVSVPHDPEIAGAEYWVGPPRLVRDEDYSDPSRTVLVAPLQCEPYYTDWSAYGLVNVYGAEIVPDSEYEVEALPEWCCAIPEQYCMSAPVAMSTAKFGDVAPLFDAPGNPPQPDFTDIANYVMKFLGNPSAPSKVYLQLVPNVVRPDEPVDFRDIAAAVRAFVGVPFSDLPEITGPCACPSDAVCGATTCANDLECPGGLCVAGFCTDSCKRCRP